MPKVYIMPSATPNAFATGRNPEHAVVAVTEGIMRILTPDELRGVLAHEMGHVANRDILVQSVASAITECARRPGDMAARWGGDEFAVVLPDTDLQGASKIAGDIKKSVESIRVPCLGGGSPLTVSVSIGVECNASAGINSVSDLIDGADRSMYAVKEAGKNQ